MTGNLTLSDLPNQHLRVPRGVYREKEEIIEALIRNNGLVSKAANDLNMTCAGLSRRINHGKDAAEFKELRKQIFEMNLDKTEKQFFKKIKEGDVQCILYHLKTHGKKRGYGDDKTQEIEQNLNWKIEIIHKVEDQTIDCEAIDCTNQKVIDAPDTDPA